MKCMAFGLVAFISLAGTQLANAADGTINFTGELTSSTCEITVNGVAASSAATVKLPKISNTGLVSAGQTAGQTLFTVQLSKCASSSGTASAFFESGATVDPISGNLINSGTAKNVALQLVDAKNGKGIKVGDAAQVTDTSRVAVDPKGAAILPYAVQYYATGATTAGTVASSVTYSINYQ